MGAGVRVQTVRYGDDAPGLVRMARSLTAAVRHLREQDPSVQVTFAIGDCGGPKNADATVAESTLEELRELLEEAGVAFDYLAFGKNTGHGAGQNALAAKSDAVEAAILVLLNPDTYVVPSCLATLVAKLGDRGVGIAEARQIPLEHPKPFDLVTGDTPWASGCTMALRRSVFEALGGFEKAFFLQGDDVDLSWRVRLSGLRVVHVPNAAVFHDKRPTATGFPEPAPAEEYHAMLARLLLAHRAERLDVIHRWMVWAGDRGSALQRDAVAAFRHEEAAGSLPLCYRDAVQVSSKKVAEVACFHEGEYADHRF
ncbi:MAG: hypothetical protein ACLPQS_15795 [Acidimicrobiales bacterium]